MTPGMITDQLQIQAAIAKSREQGWSELADGCQAAAEGSDSHGQDAFIWEELTARDPRFVRDD